VNGQPGPGDRPADVAAVLAALMTARAAGPAALAGQAECSPSHLVNILRGIYRPSAALAGRLDSALGSDGQITTALARTPLPPRPARKGRPVRQGRPACQARR
jgi:hypothetical protein